MRAWRDYGATVVGLALIAVSGLVAVLLINQDDQGDRITRLEQSPCVEDPTSKACRQVRKRLLSQEPSRISCIAFLRNGYPCPLPEIIQRQVERAAGRNTSPNNGRGGDAPSAPPGSSQPAPSPPSGGSNPNGGGSIDPNPPTSPPDNDGPVGQILDDVCELTGPLGVCLQ